jgi:hypothetical protein
MTSITNTDDALILPQQRPAGQGSSQPAAIKPPANQETVTLSAMGQKLASATENYPANRQVLPAENADMSPGETIQYRNIGGLKIAVSGHDYDTSLPGRFSNHSQLSTRDLNDWLANNPDKISKTGLQELEATPITEANRWKAPQSASWDSLFVLGSSIEQQLANKSEDFASLIQATKQLQQEYGSDIKLARDPNTESYIMLKPGDNFYESVQTADEALDNFRSYLFHAGRSSSAIEQIFNRHGIAL